MTTESRNVRRPVNLTDYNIDARGVEITFGFRFADGADELLQMHYENFAQVISLMQAIAFEAAQQRRNNPETGRAEVERILSNPVTGVEFTPDVGGRSAILRATLQTGPEGRLQLPYELLAELHAGLPALLAEMRRRQDAPGR